MVPWYYVNVCVFLSRKWQENKLQFSIRFLRDDLKFLLSIFDASSKKSEHYFLFFLLFNHFLFSFILSVFEGFKLWCFLLRIWCNWIFLMVTRSKFLAFCFDCCFCNCWFLLSDKLSNIVTSPIKYKPSFENNYFRTFKVNG